MPRRSGTASKAEASTAGAVEKTERPAEVKAAAGEETAGVAGELPKAGVRVGVGASLGRAGQGASVESVGAAGRPEALEL